MNDHELKIYPEYFDAIGVGIKKFEVRKNDRDYEVGDRIRLREWDGNAYTGRETEVEISYVLTADEFPEGIKKGYCVFCFWVTDLGGME